MRECNAPRCKRPTAEWLRTGGAAQVCTAGKARARALPVRTAGVGTERARQNARPALHAPALPRAGAGILPVLLNRHAGLAGPAVRPLVGSDEEPAGREAATGAAQGERKLAVGWLQLAWWGLLSALPMCASKERGSYTAAADAARGCGSEGKGRGDAEKSGRGSVGLERSGARAGTSAGGRAGTLWQQPGAGALHGTMSGWGAVVGVAVLHEPASGTQRPAGRAAALVHNTGDTAAAALLPNRLTAGGDTASLRAWRTGSPRQRRRPGLRLEPHRRTAR